MGLALAHRAAQWEPGRTPPRVGLCRPRSTLLMAFCDARLLRTWQGRVSSCQVLRPLDFQLRITISLEYPPPCPFHLCSGHVPLTVWTMALGLHLTLVPSP